MKFPTRCLLALAYAYSAVALGAASAGNVSISRVNGGVELEAGQQAAKVSTVNGSVRIGTDATAEAVKTVNGSVRVGERATLGSVSAVNGGVTLGEGVVVQGDAATVNGSMRLARGARIDGALRNVNGDIVLDGAVVRGNVRTATGDLRVGSGSRVEGGIHVEEKRGWRRRNERNPRITIEQGATVQGPLQFDREVDLYVAPGVELPAVEGVEPRRFRL
jgi:DUF4097 and DUF4098 domain-containing protein YvlB